MGHRVHDLPRGFHRVDLIRGQTTHVITRRRGLVPHAGCRFLCLLQRIVVFQLFHVILDGPLGFSFQAAGVLQGFLCTVAQAALGLLILFLAHRPLAHQALRPALGLRLEPLADEFPLLLRGHVRAARRRQLHHGAPVLRCPRKRPLVGARHLLLLFRGRRFIRAAAQLLQQALVPGVHLPLGFPASAEDAAPDRRPALAVRQQLQGLVRRRKVRAAAHVVEPVLRVDGVVGGPLLVGQVLPPCGLPSGPEGIPQVPLRLGRRHVDAHRLRPLRLLRGACQRRAPGLLLLVVLGYLPNQRVFPRPEIVPSARLRRRDRPAAALLVLWRCLPCLPQQVQHTVRNFFFDFRIQRHRSALHALTAHYSLLTQ